MKYEASVNRKDRVVFEGKTTQIDDTINTEDFTAYPPAPLLVLEAEITRNVHNDHMIEFRATNGVDKVIVYGSQFEAVERVVENIRKTIDEWNNETTTPEPPITDYEMPDVWSGPTVEMVETTPEIQPVEWAEMTASPDTKARSKIKRNYATPRYSVKRTLNVAGRMTAKCLFILRGMAEIPEGWYTTVELSEILDATGQGAKRPVEWVRGGVQTLARKGYLKQIGNMYSITVAGRREVERRRND